MPGSVNTNDIRAIFNGVLKPSTIRELELAEPKPLGPGNGGLAYRMLEAANGIWVHKDKDKYWPYDAVIAEGIEITEKKIEECKDLLRFFKKQRKAFAKLNSKVSGSQ